MSLVTVVSMIRGRRSCEGNFIAKCVRYGHWAYGHMTNRHCRHMRVCVCAERTFTAFALNLIEASV